MRLPLLVRLINATTKNISELEVIMVHRVIIDYGTLDTKTGYYEGGIWKSLGQHDIPKFLRLILTSTRGVGKLQEVGFIRDVRV